MTPYDHGDAPIHIAQYLHTAGVTQDPYEGQEESNPRPAIFLGTLPDTPSRAIGIIGPWVDPTDEANPDITFMIVGRGTPNNIMEVYRDLAAAHEALWRDTTFELTATRSAAYCERVTADPPATDENGRLIRVDTYHMRLHVPE